MGSPSVKELDILYKHALGSKFIMETGGGSCEINFKKYIRAVRRAKRSISIFSKAGYERQLKRDSRRIGAWLRKENNADEKT